MSLQSPFIIAIDIDEVLSEFLSQLCIFHNITYNTSLKLSDFYSYNFWETWGGTRNEATIKCYQFFNSIYFKDLPTINNSYNVLSSLKLKYNIQYVIVTSRQLDIKDQTLEWLNKNYPNLFNDVQFGHHYSNENDNRPAKSKLDMCLELNASILIDDSLIYATQCAEKLKYVLLFDLDYKYNWNKVCSPGNEYNINYNLKENILRVKNWDHVATELEKILIDYKL